MNSMIQVLCLVAISGAIGVALGLLRASKVLPIVVSVMVFCVSMLLPGWDDLVQEPHLWASYFLTNIVQTGIFVLVAEVLPLLIGYWATRRVLGMWTSKRGQV